MKKKIFFFQTIDYQLVTRLFFFKKKGPLSINTQIQVILTGNYGIKIFNAFVIIRSTVTAAC
jgi:hypothetical protein